MVGIHLIFKCTTRFYTKIVTFQFFKNYVLNELEKIKENTIIVRSHYF